MDVASNFNAGRGFTSACLTAASPDRLGIACLVNAARLSVMPSSFGRDDARVEDGTGGGIARCKSTHFL